jgi:hypothetical protein
MKTWVNGGIAVPLLSSALDGGEWSAPRICCFTLPSGERAPGTHWIGGWVGPRFGLDAVKTQGNVPGPSSPQPDSTISTLIITSNDDNVAFGPVARQSVNLRVGW